MKTKAAILRARNTPWSVEEIELDPPKTGEVLVKIIASGMCHSDEHLLTGDLAGWESFHRWLERYSSIYDTFEPVFVTFQTAAVRCRSA